MTLKVKREGKSTLFKFTDVICGWFPQQDPLPHIGAAEVDNMANLAINRCPPSSAFIAFFPDLVLGCGWLCRPTRLSRGGDPQTVTVNKSPTQMTPIGRQVGRLACERKQGGKGRKAFIQCSSWLCWNAIAGAICNNV